MEIADVLCDAVQHHRVVELFSAKDPTDRSRIVEPHAVYISSNSRGFADFWQQSGWSWSQEKPGWRRLALTDILQIRPRDEHFDPRADYRPENRQWYRAFVCTAVPISASDADAVPEDVQEVQGI